jgi:CheY-like chemotaxis protein
MRTLRQSPSRRRRILIAEDDPEMRDLVAAVLEADGYQVEAVSDGAQLLERLADAYLRAALAPYDLIITDHRMPRVHGMEVLRGLSGAGGPQVILMTAFGGADLRRQARHLGAVAVFDKPFELDDLRTAVDFALSGDHGERERQGA